MCRPGASTIAERIGEAASEPASRRKPSDNRL
jgi:hypothetical protein